MSLFYGAAHDENAMIALTHKAVNLGVTFSTRRRCMARSQTRSSSARHSRRCAKRGYRRKLRLQLRVRRQARHPIAEQPPRAHPAGRRRVVEAAEHRQHRLVLPAPGRPGSADRGCRRSGSKTDGGGQGQALLAFPQRARKRSAARMPCSPWRRCKTSTRLSGESPKGRSSPCSKSSALAWCRTALWARAF